MCIYTYEYYFQYTTFFYVLFIYLFIKWINIFN